ncbi:Multidrug resistance protein MdtO [Devosia equisanguinis]|uniref:Multidrug resistance protein MdtO n=1 Tax=Devosia equisanguinis TaxID=2490941 RepID=A0A3S4CTW2_9HYPH|nr:FUSC family protein [Devosia equisanguinis]VDS05723.1 Multidrug resistance protein MdtO [Devosia equisanguinis]
MSRPNTRRGLFDIVAEDLRPREGRLGAALRMALCCVLVVAFSMSQQVPEAALSCYLIFFASRDNAASGILIGLGLIVAATVGIGLGLLFLQIASDEPMLRLALMAGFTFAGMYFSVATKAGPIAATVGFVFAFVMTLNDFVPIPELMSRALSWMWVVVFVPMAVLVLVNALIGPNSARLVRQAVARRLLASAALLRREEGAFERADALLRESVGALASPSRLGAAFGFQGKDEAARLNVLLPQAQELLALSLSAVADQRLATGIEQLAQRIEQRDTTRHHAPLVADTRAARPLAATADAMDRIWCGAMALPARPASAPKEPADTFTNPAYAQFALKTLLAVFITYGIYTAGGWFEIHTAMITCFYVALGTTGETLHKASLRIIGCLVGAAMGIASIVFLMPHMTDIGHLLLLVAAGSFVAAWVSNGSSLIQYAGWQMALAFFLCVLPGFGPSFDTHVATNRILGILIGNVVVTIVFLWLWPTSVSSSVGAHLANGIAGLARVLKRSAGGLAAAIAEFDAAGRLARLSAFEPSRLRASSPILPHAAAILDAGHRAMPDIARLQTLRAEPRYLFGAPRRVKAATLAQEASSSGFLAVASEAILKPEPEARTMLEQSLHISFQTLGRLEHMAETAPRRAPWRSDLVAAAHTHRKLLKGFATTLEAM